MDAGIVFAIGNRHQLGIRVPSSYRFEPYPQVLLEPQVFKFDGYRRKADRFHGCYDCVGRPEVRKINQKSLGEILVIEPIRVLLRAEIPHHKPPVTSKDSIYLVEHTRFIGYVVEAKLTGNEIESFGLKRQYRAICLNPNYIL